MFLNIIPPSGVLVLPVLTRSALCRVIVQEMYIDVVVTSG